MSTIIKSIGTTGRDYSTIAAWINHLDNDTIYSAGDIARGECYNDSSFSETIEISGGNIVGLSKIQLAVANGEQHSGKSGTGVRIIAPGGNDVVTITTSVNTDLIDLEIDGNKNDIHRLIIHDGNCTVRCLRVICHNIRSSHTNAFGFYRTAGGGRIFHCFNCIAYNIKNSNVGGSFCGGFFIDGSVEAKFINCTSHNIVNDNGSGPARCFSMGGFSGHEIYNCIGTDASGTSSGAKKCFNLGGSVVSSNNLSSDNTGNITGVLSSDLYISNLNNFHLKTNSPALNEGIIINSIDDVNIDIDGHNRFNKIRSGNWDIGADELVRIPNKTLIGNSNSFPTVFPSIFN